MAGKFDMEEIIEKRPHHPLATAMLIITFVATVGAITFTVMEGKHYVNQETAELVNTDGSAQDEAKSWLRSNRPEWVEGGSSADRGGAGE